MPPRIYGALYLAFFLSGAAALFYQISWERLLALSIGGDVAAVALIVSAFMTGLGLGSWIGGKCADKISFRWNFLFFILAEVGIGAFGVFSGDLFSRQLPQVLGLASVSRTTETIILFLVLLAPTFLMGVSLPVLSRILGAGTPIGKNLFFARFLQLARAVSSRGALKGELLFRVRNMGPTPRVLPCPERKTRSSSPPIRFFP
jgi:predicted membrane-bound spermidine synthase